MNYGMYLSATGALTSMHRQDVIANNLANAQTVGFKPDAVYFKARPVERLEDPSFSVHPHLTLEELTGGHFTAPSRINLTQGPLQRTGNPLDAGIRGEGFFVVQDGRRTNGPADPRRTPAEALRLTRDGRFTLNARGEMVLAANGMRVLDVENRPVRTTSGSNVRIDSTGNVFENGSRIAQLRIAHVGDPEFLEKSGHNLFRFKGRMEDLHPPAKVEIEPGHIEQSAVDSIMTLNAMINATKSVQANARMIQFHDTLMDQAINRFARVA